MSVSQSKGSACFHGIADIVFGLSDRCFYIISMCQLGLFGYAVKGKPTYRIFEAWTDMPEELAAAVQAAAVDGRISCSALWETGKQFGLSRHEMGNAAEGLGLKVKPCQLGCF